MRHKIQALIVHDGVPAIWFTINPNDITNSVKLRLPAYRTRDPGAAEEFLRSLDMSFKRMRLSISDPMSSAIFFHREMTLFFEHYVESRRRIGVLWKLMNEVRFMSMGYSRCTETRI